MYDLHKHIIEFWTSYYQVAIFKWIENSHDYYVGPTTKLPKDLEDDLPRTTHQGTIKSKTKNKCFGFGFILLQK